MPKLQEVFNRIKANRKKQKDIKNSYKDALESSHAYQDVINELRSLKAKKKSIEAEIKSDFSSEFTKLDDLKIDIDSDMELMSDLAITQLMKGQTVEVKDEFDNEYEPIFKVNFKKS